MKKTCRCSCCRGPLSTFSSNGSRPTCSRPRCRRRELLGLFLVCAHRERHTCYFTITWERSMARSGRGDLLEEVPAQFLTRSPMPHVKQELRFASRLESQTLL